jgi:hypothetical protein
MKLLVRAALSESDASPGESFEDVFCDVDTGRGVTRGDWLCKRADKRPLWRLKIEPSAAALIVAVSAQVPLEAGFASEVSIGFTQVEA